MDGIWVVYLFLAAFPALIVFAAIYKYTEIQQASRWPSVPGTVVISATEARRVRSGGPDSDDTELRNFARVVYEYKIAPAPIAVIASASARTWATRRSPRRWLNIRLAGLLLSTTTQTTAIRR